LLLAEKKYRPTVPPVETAGSIPQRSYALAFGVSPLAVHNIIDYYVYVRLEVIKWEGDLAEWRKARD
jgi:hypothetical protein